MTKEYTNREIVEGLDESVVCWHEIKEDTDQTSEDYGVPVHFTYCGLCETVNPDPNPEPTLEWMLEKLLEKELIWNVDFDKKPALGRRCVIHCYDKSKNVVHIAKNCTLALRGAVCKLLESEEK